MADIERDRRDILPKAILPISEYVAEIKESISRNPTTIVIGETGSGKTTQIPLILLDTLPPQAKIAVTQPRRIAATSVAQYVANQRGSRIGGEVGYQVRFDNSTSLGTRVNFYTDGILLRKIQADPMLLDFDAVMVDEAHERNLQTDLLLGLLKNIQEKRQKMGRELRLVVTSATLEEEKFVNFFNNAPIVRVPGRQFPVDIHYEKSEANFAQAAAKKAKEIVDRNEEGNILIFMSGVAAIQETIKIIQQEDIDAIVLPLHGGLTAEEQDRVFQTGRRRRIIVATNIAETSVTIPNVRFVVDTGLVRQNEFDQKTGIEGLVTKMHAKSGCDQRAGRAGRVGPGECYRLYEEDNYEKRERFQKPEIQRVNIEHLVLQMKKIGIQDVETFDFIDLPQKQQLTRAIEVLQELGALDEEENLTKIGELMAELPLEPHAARSVIEAVTLGCVDEVSTIMAFLELRPVFLDQSPRQIDERFIARESDFLTLLTIWSQFDVHGRSKQWAQDNLLNFSVLAEATNIRNQLLGIMKRFGYEQQQSASNEAIAKAIIAGRIDNLIENTNRGYRLIRQPTVKVSIHPSSVLRRSGSRFLIAFDVLEVDGSTSARLCQVVKPEWIPQVAPQVLTREDKKPKKLKSGRVMWGYNPKTGEVLVNGVAVKANDFSEENMSERKKAVLMFANRLSEEHASKMRLGKRILSKDIVEHNQRVMALVWAYWERSGRNLPNGLDPQQAFRPQGLTKVFEKRLGTIISKTELDQALQEGTMDLFLHLEDYIPEEIRETVIFDSNDISFTPQVKRKKHRKK